MKTWTKAACLGLCAGLLVSSVAAGLANRDPQDELKKAREQARKQVEDAKKKLTQPPAKPGDKPTMGDEMAKMKELSKTVAEHDIIKNFAGNWHAEVKTWEPSQTDPTSSKGTMKCRLLHGGRYLQGDFTGEFMGEPFSGTLMWAFNRVDARYESTWCDSISTGIMTATGHASADGKSVESTGTFRMPGADGKLMEITQREKTTMVSKDKYTLETWHGAKDQGEMKVMEITYTRFAEGAKPAAPAAPGITMPPASR
jgi:hypothetical protein